MEYVEVESEVVKKFKTVLNKSLYVEIVKIVDGSEAEEQGKYPQPIKDRQWKVYLKDFTPKDGGSVISEHNFCWWMASFDKLSQAWGKSTQDWHGKRIEVTLYQNGKFVNERGVSPA